MKRLGQKIILILLALYLLSSCAYAESSSAVNWTSWNDRIFESAASQNKFVLLDLEAIWCHWCHVMDQTTYRDEQVAKILNSKFIAVKVDQDSRPDLSNRYREYGWPATIIFNSEGKELRKLSGYLEPEELVKILSEVLDGKSAAKETKSVNYSSNQFLSTTLRQKLVDCHYQTHDYELGGLKLSKKTLDPESTEYSLLLASRGDRKNEEMVRRTLDNAIKLIDPVWGGAYQYSTHRDWDHPHYEKIIPFQVRFLKLYSLAYSYLRDPRYLTAAKDVQRYLEKFLMSPEGAFYTSQDADRVKGEHSEEYFKLDDAGRRKLGIPTIDKSIYSRENGLVITGLVALYATSGDRKFLDQATRAAHYILKNRSLNGGGFSHSAADNAGPFLADNLAMAQGLLAIYSVSGERSWLKLAESTMQFIFANFRSRDGTPGLLSSVPSGPLSPAVILEENVDSLRTANLLSHYTGRKEFLDFAKSIMPYLSTEEIALRRVCEQGILLADEELSHDPLHLTVVGFKDDKNAAELFAAASEVPGIYKRQEWWDKREGDMPNSDVQYPQLDKPAAFICTAKRCSLPIFEPERIADTVKRIQSQKS